MGKFGIFTFGSNKMSQITIDWHANNGLLRMRSEKVRFWNQYFGKIQI